MTGQNHLQNTTQKTKDWREVWRA